MAKRNQKPNDAQVPAGAAVVEEPDDDLAELPKAVAKAARDLGLRADHILKHEPAGTGRIKIVTKGGRKLFWPEDAQRPAPGQPSRADLLTDEEKDGIARTKPGKRIFGGAAGA